MSRHFKDVTRVAKKYGWQTRVTGGSHIAVFADGYRTVYASNTPRNAGRALVKTECDIRREIKRKLTMSDGNDCNS